RRPPAFRPRCIRPPGRRPPARHHKESPRQRADANQTTLPASLVAVANRRLCAQSHDLLVWSSLWSSACRVAHASLVPRVRLTSAMSEKPSPTEPGGFPDAEPEVTYSEDPLDTPSPTQPEGTTTEVVRSDGREHALVRRFRLLVTAGPDSGVSFTSLGERVV